MIVQHLQLCNYIPFMAFRQVNAYEIVWSFGKVKSEKRKVKLLPAVVFALALAVLRNVHSVPSPAAETVQVRVKHGDMVVTGPLEEYLVGVVAAEMPADFAPEALRRGRVYGLSLLPGLEKRGGHG